LFILKYFHFCIAAETLLGNLSASFDQKMRLLLDPSYQTPASREGSPRPPDTPTLNSSLPSVLLAAQHDSSPSTGAASPTVADLSGPRKDMDDVCNELLRARVAARKVELRRSGRVETKRGTVGEQRHPDLPEASRRPVGRQEPVLRQVNNRQPLKRSDSLTKREKTELNQRTKLVGEKENKVLRLKAQFEQGASSAGGRALSRPLAAVHATSGSGTSGNFDISKVRKKLSDSRNRRIKRRHTVGGTKDFTENILSKLTGEEWVATSRSKSSWDRLAAPVIWSEDLMERRRLADWEEGEERRLSLPDCAGEDGPVRLASGPARPVESHV